MYDMKQPELEEDAFGRCLQTQGPEIDLPSGFEEKLRRRLEAAMQAREDRPDGRADRVGWRRRFRQR